MTETWPLVARAQAAARQSGFALSRDDLTHEPGRGSASLPETGRFLAMLAAGCHGGVIAEFGTGTGVGTAWLASAMPPDCALVTAEIDPARAAVAAQLFAGDPRVRVLTGDAHAVLTPLAPFDLIFTDCGQATGNGRPYLADRVAMLKPGGHIVADDLTPVLALPAGSPFREYDPKRAEWAAEARLAWTEVVLPDLANSLLVGTRVS
jgi:predicted O-methyltransferase YrrM